MFTSSKRAALEQLVNELFVYNATGQCFDPRGSFGALAVMRTIEAIASGKLSKHQQLESKRLFRSLREKRKAYERKLRHEEREQLRRLSTPAKARR